MLKCHFIVIASNELTSVREVIISAEALRSVREVIISAEGVREVISSTDERL
jgi:23S rRNA maturation-related 3'-5' exoribonuclease YhaM